MHAAGVDCKGCFILDGRLKATATGLDRRLTRAGALLRVLLPLGLGHVLKTIKSSGWGWLVTAELSSEETARLGSG